jgi:hypothetical protein
VTKVKIRTPDVAFVFDGDSFNNRPVVPDNVPTILPAELGFPAYNVGVNSQQAATWKYGVTQRVRQYVNTAPVTIYHLMIGVNDIGANLDGVDTYDHKVEMADAARALGFTYVVSMTTPPYTGTTAPQTTQRNALNAAMLADASNAFDLVVDLTGDSGMNNAAGAYYSDGLHWSATGAAAYVAIAAPLIEAML